MLKSTVASMSLVLIGAVSVDALKTFTLPESKLLFGNYNDLRIATPDSVQQIRPPFDEGFNRGYFAYPSISPNGDTIAWGFATRWQQDKYRARFGLGVYALAAQKWKTYGDYDDIGTVAFSPTGSKVAFVARQQGKVKEDLLIFNVATETVTTAPHPQGWLETKGSMGWSRDETRLAIEIQQDQPASSLKPTELDADRGPAIGVLEINNGSVQLFGNGFGPAWSPTGEWIAYYDPTGKKCLLMHPDGTGLKTATTVKDSWFSARSFGGTAPVWSADGKHLLLNVIKNGGPLIDVVLLDLATGHTTTKSKSGLLVFGWVPYRRGATEKE